MDVDFQEFAHKRGLEDRTALEYRQRYFLEALTAKVMF